MTALIRSTSSSKHSTLLFGSVTFPWLNEPSPFCHERAESLSFRLINNQILVEEFNDETVFLGKMIDEVTLQLYRYHKKAQETKLLFEFTKLKP